MSDVRLAEWLATASATQAWDTLDAFREGDVEVGRMVAQFPDGTLLSWTDRAGPRCVLQLDGWSDARNARLEALSRVRHPHLARWHEVRSDEEDLGVLVFGDPLPERTIAEGVASDPDEAPAWFHQLASALLALHRAGLAHGAVAEAPLGIVGGRARLGLASLGGSGDPAADLRALGMRAAEWPDPVHEIAGDLARGVLDGAGLALAILDWGLRPQDDRYLERGDIGSGGMGIVYRRFDPRLERTVALKTLKEGSVHGYAEFIEEAKRTAQLQHPGIVAVHEIGWLDDGRPFYTMEEVGGTRLDGLIRDPDVSGLVRRVDIFARICETMAYVHDQGLVHRDLKPANIQVGEFGEVRVLDWGLATATGTVQDGFVGTTGFAAPEQRAGGVVDARTDVFALGQILHRILAREEDHDVAVEELQALAEACSALEAQDRPDFERSLEELEALVGKMEKGDLSLEDSLAQFERGIALTRTCQQALREAEQVTPDENEWLFKRLGWDEKTSPAERALIEFLNL
ncbi:MAG: exodeoxyribonuclease VII small subunit, partial [Myxococcota bacterium]